MSLITIQGVSASVPDLHAVCEELPRERCASFDLKRISSAVRDTRLKQLQTSWNTLLMQVNIFRHSLYQLTDQISCLLLTGFIIKTFFPKKKYVIIPFILTTSNKEQKYVMIEIATYFSVDCDCKSEISLKQNSKNSK